MTRTYLDSGVLIAAARGTDDLAAEALAVLSDPNRVFVSSIFVQLEVLPKPIYNKYLEEAQFYDAYFAVIADWAPTDIPLNALQLAKRYGLSALDALHVAAAIALSADELVTTEGQDKPMHRVTEVRIVGM
jgi:predicted nucleic acid-binding protein